MYRKTYVEINLDTIEENIKKIKTTYSGYKYYIGVVKNNAYGHGIYSINAMINGGINYLAVSSLEEALEVRKINKEIPVLILEPISLESTKVAAENNITITVDNTEYFDTLIENNIKVKFHLKIDSGMNRFGLKEKEKVNYIFEKSSEILYLEGIYTHLSNGRTNSEIYINQINSFKHLTSDIDLSKIEIVHLDRSLTMEQHEKIEFANGVRMGIAMYGIAYTPPKPSWKRRLLNKLTFKKNEIIKPKLDLNTAFEFKTHILEVKDVKKGEIVGYGGTYSAKEDIKIALMPYGFADYLYNGMNEVYIKGKAYQVISINMDVTTILIDDTISVGDEVEVFGKQISLRKRSREIGQNIYKLLTSITTRVPRIYKYKNEEIEIKY